MNPDPALRVQPDALRCLLLLALLYGAAWLLIYVVSEVIDLAIKRKGRKE